MSERSSQESKTTYEDFSKNFFDSARDTNIEKIKGTHLFHNNSPICKK